MEAVKLVVIGKREIESRIEQKETIPASLGVSVI